MGESRYIRDSMVLFSVFRGEIKIAKTGVSIMVMNPLDISDIILAILVLSIVYCNGKRGVWKVVGIYSGFVIQDGSDIPSVRISWDVSIGGSCFVKKKGTVNVFIIVIMIIVVNMGYYTIMKGFLKEKDRGLALSSLGSF